MKKPGTSMDSSGFTLVELALSMSIFIAMMVIATMGFVGMTRTVQRGLVHKQLSEAVQSITDQLTEAIRSTGGTVPTSCPAGSTLSGCGGAPTSCATAPNGSTQAGCWSRSCARFGRYFWQNDADGPYGLYQDNKPCDQPVAVNDTGTITDTTATAKVMDTKYRVRQLEVTSMTVPRLYQIQGVFSTTNDDAFNNITASDPRDIECRGTTDSNSLSHNCAIEKFKFIVSTRTGTQK